MHIFWSSPRMANFWKVVRRIVQKFTDRNIPDKPAFFLLHASDTPEHIYKKSVTCHLLDAAKACIPLPWKSPHPPTIDLWLKKVDEIKKWKTSFSQLKIDRRHSKTWQLWNMFIYSDEGQARRGNTSDT